MSGLDEPLTHASLMLEQEQVRPGVIARLSWRRGRAEAFDDSALLLDGLALVLGDAIERLGVEQVVGSLRLTAGLARAQADQLRNASRATVWPQEPRDGPDG